MKSIKATLQSNEWQDFLDEEAEQGNDDALAILDYMQKRGWILKNPHPPPKPALRAMKPKTEV